MPKPFLPVRHYTPRPRKPKRDIGGRPTKLTPEVHGKIVMAIRAGSYAEVAAQYAGINPSTFYGWMKRGRAGESPYLEFYNAIKNAEPVAELTALAEIQKAGRETWQANAWYLERRHPQRWGRRDRAPIEWRDEVMGWLRDGRVTPDEVRELLGSDGNELVNEFFAGRAAGLPVFEGAGEQSEADGE